MKHIKLIGIALFLAALVLGYFIYLNHNKVTQVKEVDAQATKVQEVIMRNLDNRYPPTPKELVRFYAEISQCYYNESYTEEELAEMAGQMRRIFDDELVELNSPFESYLEGLKSEIAFFAENDYMITNYAVSDSVDVEYFVDDGFEWSRLHCFFYIRVGTQTSTAHDHHMLLRKDAEGHWKIYGWVLEEAEDSGES